MIDKCYEGMATIPQRINDPCGGNPISTNCVQSPVANPYLSLPSGATQTQINAALSSALIYKDSQIATISNQPPLQLKTVGGKSLLGSGDIPFPSGGTKTKGAITATKNYPSDEVVLIYDYNEVTAPTGDGYVVLPDTDLIGREVIVFAKNTTNNIFVQVNQAYPSKLVGGSGGIDSNTDFLKIKPNESYRFLSLEDDYWFYENITNDNKIYSPSIPVTYNELTTLISNSELIIGQVYILTDYMTTYIQPITNIYMESGVIEPLYLTAISINKLSQIGKSQIHPQDTIYYEITGDIGNGAGTEGFTKGKIYRRIDNVRNNDIGTDWRHIKYSRGVDKLLFEDYTNCYNNVIECVKLTNTTVGNNFYNNKLKGTILTNTIGNNFINNIIGDDFRSNTILTGMNNNTIGYKFTGNNIGVDFFYNTIGNEFINNATNGIFAHNKIGSEFRQNIIAAGFQINTINYYFISNNIGMNCAHNFFQNYTSQNRIGNNFSSNRTDNDFSFNIIGSGFIGNSIDYNFSNNNVGTDFVNNNIGKGWIYKTIGNNIQNNNFTVATLPTGLTINQRLIVTDALAPTYLSTVVGGGTVIAPVIWNGTNWVYN